MTRLVLYGRQGCHLCDEANDAIVRLRDELGPFELHAVDIDSDDALHKAYLERIPVVEVDGVIVSDLELDVRAVREALRRRRG
ncbi:MAG: glutaredoxin family protein [Solirubrobacterales bacterium]